MNQGECICQYITKTTLAVAQVGLVKATTICIKDRKLLFDSNQKEETPVFLRF